MKDNTLLAQEYFQCAEKIKERMDNLKQELHTAKTDGDVFQINRRLKLLQYEYYDCLKIARYLEKQTISTTLENGLWASSKDIYRPNKKPKYLS